ncbi:MAG: hypothetical protein AB7O04_06215 [Hyphomonadaceae bacterium]
MDPFDESDLTQPSAFDVASYLYLSSRELAAMARGAGLAETAAAFDQARDSAAQALTRLGQPGSLP